MPPGPPDVGVSVGVMPGTSCMTCWHAASSRPASEDSCCSGNVTAAAVAAGAPADAPPAGVAAGEDVIGC
jgi:hypothetical protein